MAMVLSILGMVSPILIGQGGYTTAFDYSDLAKGGYFLQAY